MRLRPDFASARANLRHAKRKLEGGGAKSVVIEVSEDNEPRRRRRGARAA